MITQQKNNVVDNVGDNLSPMSCVLRQRSCALSSSLHHHSTNRAHLGHHALGPKAGGAHQHKSQTIEATFTKNNFLFLQQYHKKLFIGVNNEIERLRQENLTMKRMLAIKRKLSQSSTFKAKQLPRSVSAPTRGPTEVLHRTTTPCREDYQEFENSVFVSQFVDRLIEEDHIDRIVDLHFYAQEDGIIFESSGENGRRQTFKASSSDCAKLLNKMQSLLVEHRGCKICLKKEVPLRSLSVLNLQDSAESQSGDCSQENIGCDNEELHGEDKVSEISEMLKTSGNVTTTFAEQSATAAALSEETDGADLEGSNGGAGEDGKRKSSSKSRASWYSKIRHKFWMRSG